MVRIHFFNINQLQNVLPVFLLHRLPLCRLHTVETRVPRELRPFRLLTRIMQPILIHRGPCLHYDANTDELFVAAPMQRTVNVMSTAATNSPNAPPRPVYTAPPPAEPSSVCLVRQTGTLLVANVADRNREGQVGFSLVALSRDEQQWRQQSELQVSIETRSNSFLNSTLCESNDFNVLLGAYMSRQLLVLRLTPAHRLALLRKLETREPYYSYSVNCAGVEKRPLVALTLVSLNTVSVNRLLEDRLEPLAHLRLDLWPSFVLWCGEHLLLTDKSKNTDMTLIVELDTARTPLARASELLPRAAGVQLRTWCADGERVCVWDENSNDILVYSIY